jgi:Spy/CpxP family protein refolding chaperone
LTPVFAGVTLGLMSNVNTVSLSISITETSSSNSSNSDATQNATQTKQNPFLNPNGPFANLDLTAQQQQQIAQIFSQDSSGQGSSGSGQSWSQLFSQVNAILTPQQQQTLQGDVQTLQADHHHRHGGGSSSSSNPLSQLDLTSAQQTQIGQIIQAAQTDGDSSSDTLSQIDAVLTPAQQQQLVSLFSADTATGSSSTASTQPYVINTSA